MSAEITAWLDEAQEKVDDATPGPWATDLRLDGRAWVDVPGIDGHAFGLHGFPDDAAFIADARTRLPQAIAALRAVLGFVEECEADSRRHALADDLTAAITAALGVQP